MRTYTALITPRTEPNPDLVSHSSMNERSQPVGIKQYVKCPNCRGIGSDPSAPHREASDGTLIRLIRACPKCDGHGVVNVSDLKDLNPTQSYSALVDL